MIFIAAVIHVVVSLFFTLSQVAESSWMRWGAGVLPRKFQWRKLELYCILRHFVWMLIDFFLSSANEVKPVSKMGGPSARPADLKDPRSNTIPCNVIITSKRLEEDAKPVSRATFSTLPHFIGFSGCKLIAINSFISCVLTKSMNRPWKLINFSMYFHAIFIRARFLNDRVILRYLLYRFFHQWFLSVMKCIMHSRSFHRSFSRRAFH